MTLHPPDLVRVVLKPGIEISLDDARENSAATVELAGDRPILLLIDTRKARGISRQARMHFSEPEQVRHTRAQALLVDSGPSRVIGNFFLGFVRAPFPMKLFTSEAVAEAWLRGVSA